VITEGIAYLLQQFWGIPISPYLLGLVLPSPPFLSVEE
jgi:hypothetical protein